MTLAFIHTMLEHVEGFTGRVAYNAFPDGEAVGLPFIAYRVVESANMLADNRVYCTAAVIEIELYTAIKSPKTERRLENALDAADIVWNKRETYLSDEKCYEIIYEIEVLIDGE